MSLGPSQERYWRQHLEQSGDDGHATYVVASYAGSPEITDQLIDLYLAGRKSAGSGLVDDYLASGDPLPQVGDHWIALGADGEPRCILVPHSNVGDVVQPDASATYDSLTGSSVR